MATEHDPVRVEIASSTVMADLYAAALKEAGIPVFVPGAALADEFGAMGKIVGVIGTEIHVARKDAARALAIIDRLRPTEGPEGGAHGTWRCDSCDETIEETFESCWKCSAARPVGATIHPAPAGVVSDAAEPAPPKPDVSSAEPWPKDDRSTTRVWIDTAVAAGLALGLGANLGRRIASSNGASNDAAILYDVAELVVYAAVALAVFSRVEKGAPRFKKDLAVSALLGVALLLVHVFVAGLWSGFSDGRVFAESANESDAPPSAITLGEDVLGVAWRLVRGLLVAPTLFVGCTRILRSRGRGIFLAAALLSIALPRTYSGFFVAEAFVGWLLLGAAYFLFRSAPPLAGAPIIHRVVLRLLP